AGGYLELSGRRVEPAVDRPLDAQRAPRFLAHDRRRTNEVAARLTRPVTAPPDRRRLLGLQTVREHLRQVAHDALGIRDLARPLTDWLRVDASAPPLDEHAAQLGAVRHGDALNQQVQMQRAAPLELHLHEPLALGPPLPRRLQELRQMPPALRSGQVLARREDEPERRRPLHRVEREHLHGLDHVEALAVPTEVRRLAPAGEKFARRVIQQPQFFGPPLALPGEGVVNSLMQVKGPLRGPAVSVEELT